MNEPAPARLPYVGEGADGCRRSAAIDLSEAEGMDLDDPRRDHVLLSALAWQQQAELEDLRARAAAP